MNRLPRSLATLAVVGSVGLLWMVPTRGESPAPPIPPALAELPALTAAEASSLLRDLSSVDYETRRAATRALVEAGGRAIDAVAKGAETSELETATRCLDVLKKLLQSNDAATKAAAEAALKKLSEGEHRSIAQRAADVIRKPEPVATRAGVFGVPIQVQVGGIQVQGGGPFQGRIVLPAAPGFRMEMSREATVIENGKTIRLRETSGKGREITVEITEAVDGKLKKTKTTAASSIDLKQKHPEAYQHYLKHLVTKAYVNRPVPVADVRQAGGAVPVPGAVPGVVPGAIPNIRRVAPAFPFPLPGVPKAPGVAGQKFSMKVQVVNGQRSIEVDDGTKKVEISDLNGKEITVKVTETVDGKEKTTETKAADLDDLKKKSPDAAKIYEQYSQGGAGQIQINGGAGGIQIQVEAQAEAGPIEAIPARAIPIQALPVQPVPLPAIPEPRDDAPARKP